MFYVLFDVLIKLSDLIHYVRCINNIKSLNQPLLDFETLFKYYSAKYLYRNFKLCKMIDNNVTEGNAVLVFRNIVLLFVIGKLLILFVCDIVARHLNF